MSYSCTLHPVDPRVYKSMIAGVKGEKADWDFLTRLRNQKQLINRINQPFKDGLKEILADIPDFQIDLHLWGRPFFIYNNETTEINLKIAKLYGINKEATILEFFLNELREFSEKAYQFRVGFKCQGYKELSLGLNRALAKLSADLKHKYYKELGLDLGFVLAQLLGVAYPYWDLENYTLSFLKDLQIPGWVETPEGLRAVFGEFEAVLPFVSQQLERNLSSGIYLNPREVEELLELLTLQESYIIFRLAEKQVSGTTADISLRKVREALSYAKEYRFGLLEASDIYEKSPKRYP